MTPEEEAGAIAASDEFLADPAAALNFHIARAASLHARTRPWLNDGARRLTRVCLILAEGAGLEHGHVLGSLAERYGGPANPMQPGAAG